MGDGRDNGQKRKRPDNARQQFGGRNKKKELGRGDFGSVYEQTISHDITDNALTIEARRQNRDRRAVNEEQNAKRQKIEAEDDGKPSVLPKPFSQEEIDAEERKPKYKVAVLIGYSGTGYRGMQISNTERTIEGDLFTAFVKAGAISKANANDPKKSGLVRCARTDKGVHAAGNIVSLKLIIEDPNTVENINAHLSPQIRVWGIQRTVGSFSCYQSCDSRWYEYLIPSHAFLPPNPASFLARTILEHAEETGDLEAHSVRQKDVSGWWDQTNEDDINPIIDQIEDLTLRELVRKAMFEPEELVDTEEIDATTKEVASSKADEESKQPVLKDLEAIVTGVEQEDVKQEDVKQEDVKQDDVKQDDVKRDEFKPEGDSAVAADAGSTESKVNENPSDALDTATRKRIEVVTRQLRGAYIRAKARYRIPSARLDRIQAVLDTFLGTHNFHNYTVAKAPGDPSAKRVIKSFRLDRTPKIINGTEWLSIKIHGQSFMMHQIRKMISAVALVVRCGCPITRIGETLSQRVGISIPKVPGLGLLLERPVFDSYNENAAAKYEREPISFAKYEATMDEFKQREIYERIFREEEEQQQFYTFFAHVDSFKDPAFLWVTSKGIEATNGGRTMKQGNGSDSREWKKRKGANRARDAKVAVDSDDDVDANEKGRQDMDG